MSDKIWLSPPHLSGEELKYIKDAFDKNWISPYGDNIDSFESKLEAYFEVPDVALVNSGTSAIHLSLILAGIGPGDEVIVPTLNFAGCVNPILYQKAIPLFIDSESDTWNIDPMIAEEVIISKIKSGKKPKAIIAVHLFGMPCKIEAILALGTKYNIPVIEDAADALGSTVNGKKTGAFGLSGIISFNGNKTITTSGGGVLISKDPEIIRQAKHLSNQARTLKPYYVHDAVGYNYMMSNILAGLGTAQMEVLEQRIAKRREIYSIYKSELSRQSNIFFPEEPEGSHSNRWLTSILLDNEKSRDHLYHSLAENNIESRPVWNPMHRQPAFSSFPFYGAETAQQLFEKGLCLPSGSSMTEEQLERIIACIKKYMQ